MKSKRQNVLGVENFVSMNVNISNLVCLMNTTLIIYILMKTILFTEEISITAEGLQ